MVLVSLLQPRFYNHWRIIGRIASFLYVSGITSTGGCITMTSDGTTYHLPHWHDVLPYRFRRDLPDSLRHGYHMRPYLLWKHNWWWECHMRQGWKLWKHHHPYPPAGFGICGRCLPCPECGSPDLWCECYD